MLLDNTLVIVNQNYATFCYSKHSTAASVKLLTVIFWTMKRVKNRHHRLSYCTLGCLISTIAITATDAGNIYMRVLRSLRQSEGIKNS